MPPGGVRFEALLRSSSAGGSLLPFHRFGLHRVVPAGLGRFARVRALFNHTVSCCTERNRSAWRSRAKRWKKPQRAGQDLVPEARGALFFNGHGGPGEGTERTLRKWSFCGEGGKPFRRWRRSFEEYFPRPPLAGGIEAGRAFRAVSAFKLRTARSFLAHGTDAFPVPGWTARTIGGRGRAAVGQGDGPPSKGGGGGGGARGRGIFVAYGPPPGFARSAPGGGRTAITFRLLQPFRVPEEFPPLDQAGLCRAGPEFWGGFLWFHSGGPSPLVGTAETLHRRTCPAFPAPQPRVWRDRGTTP